MGPLVGFVCLIASSFAVPTGLHSLIDPIYHLKSPANVLVEYGAGLTASAVQTRLFLRLIDNSDPTSSLVCRKLQNDYTVFFVPQSSMQTFVENPVSKTVKVGEELNTKSGKMPWIVFLKKENTIELPSDYRKINLKSNNPDDPWELGAYTLAPPGSELAEYPDEVLAAPPPFFPSLCVSPEKPKPFPVLFAPSAQQNAVVPSLASYSFGDLTPAVATHPASEAASMVSADSPTKLVVPASPSAEAPAKITPVFVEVGGPVADDVKSIIVPKVE